MGRRDRQTAPAPFEDEAASAKQETEKDRTPAKHGDPALYALDVRRFVRRLQATPIAIGIGTVSFIAFCIGCCVGKAGGDAVALDFDRQVGFLFWPVPAHFSCFLLNLKSYHFQTAPLKRKFMALNLYSSACAVASYWLMAEAARFRLLNYDAWGRCFIFFRPVQWIHTTPAMLHQLLMLADQSTFQIVRLHTANVLMLILGLIGHVVLNKAAASVILSLCWLVFAFEMFLVHQLFQIVAANAASLNIVDVRSAAHKSGGHKAAAAPGPDEDTVSRDVEKGFTSFEAGKLMEVRMIRHLHLYTVLLWTCFGVVDILHTTAAVPLVVVEHVWGGLDVAAKVLFSSSLTMTGVVSLYEAEKQEAWLAEQRAAAIADAATEANRQVLMAHAITAEKAEEQAGRIDALSSLVQEGWALVVGDMMQAGQIPAGYDGEPMKIPSLADSSVEEQSTIRSSFAARASSTLKSFGIPLDPAAAARQRSRGGMSGSAQVSVGASRASSTGGEGQPAPAPSGKSHQGLATQPEEEAGAGGGGGGAAPEGGGAGEGAPGPPVPAAQVSGGGAG